MGKKNTQFNFDAVVAVHHLLAQLPKAADVFDYGRKHGSPSDALDKQDMDGLAQMVLFYEEIRNLRVPKDWLRSAKLYHLLAARRLAVNSRNVLDRIAEA